MQIRNLTAIGTMVLAFTAAACSRQTETAEEAATKAAADLTAAAQ